MAQGNWSFWGCEIRSFRLWLKLFLLQILVNLVAVAFTVVLLFACSLLGETFGHIAANAVVFVYTCLALIQIGLLILNILLKTCGRRGILHVSENGNKFHVSTNACPFCRVA